MILLFLRDLRSVIVVVLNIPLAFTGSLFGLLADRQHDQHHVAGWHGPGHRHAGRRGDGLDREHSRPNEENEEPGRAVERGSMQTAVPRLLAMLCILSVFIPAFIMTDPLRALFMPLALAVGFAMISSYLLSSTLVPVVCVWLLKHHGQHDASGQKAGAVRSRAGKFRDGRGLD